MEDPWREIRAETYGNVEPEVKLIATTVPSYPNIDGDPRSSVECIPAMAAGTSYNKKATTIEKAIELNKKLIKMGHLVPLEALQFNFHVTGISKACGAQWSRHRHQSHVSLSRRYTQQQPRFIYPLLANITESYRARSMYQQLGGFCESAMCYYDQMINNGLNKSEARLFMPVNVSTTRNTWANTRALRDFFELRLAPSAEWEIRRIATMLLHTVVQATPSLFEDLL